MPEPPYPRQTSTPPRKRGPGSGRAALFVVVGLLLVAAILGWQSSTGAKDSGASTRASSALGLEAAAPAIPAGPTPCAYCNQDPNRWRAFTAKPPPEIGGKSAAIIEAACGALLYGAGENDRRPPASLAKIVSALVAVDRARLGDQVDIKINGWDLSAEDGSTIMGLEAGMRLTVEDLLYGMLLVSGNDAALAMADHLGGSTRFVDLMNAKVAQLGLGNTHFTTPDGRDSAGQYSSALDMALLGRALLQVPALKTIVNTKTYMPHWDGRQLSNANEMIWAYNDAVGVKIGYTETADYTIVTGVERGGRLLIAAVFGSWNLYNDPVNLLNWAFANTRTACPN